MSPVADINAQGTNPPNGTCRYRESSSSTTILERNTYDTCKAKPVYINWKESTLAEFQAEQKALAEKDTALGTCRYYDPYPTAVIVRTTHDTCNKNPSYITWKQSTLAEFEAERKAMESGTTPGTPSTPDTRYKLLTPLPCDNKTPGCENGELKYFDPASNDKENSKLGEYLNIMLRIFIGICAVLAVIMIVMGGIEYMTTELISSKEEGRKRITNAIFGLLLALGAYTLLNTINPDLLNTDLKSLKTATVVVDLGGEGTTPLNEATAPAELRSAGINCPKGGGGAALTAIAQSYIGHSAYDMSKRNTTSGGTAYVDCSSYVSQVYVCAGLGNPGGTTAGIFGGGSTTIVSISADGTMVNDTPLKIGDLLGWRQGENKEKWGHVVMYIGNGQVIDAQGQGGVAVRSLNSDQFKGRIKYVKKI